MQRLFSTFASGWPGFGLLILRLLTSALLVFFGIASLRESPPAQIAVPQFIGVVSGLLILGGLWTPLAGSLAAVLKVWIAFTSSGDPWIPVMQAALGAALAMIGPGAWSIDAKLFGRKHIDLPESR